MPSQPSISQVHLDVPLTNFALQYKSPDYLGYNIAQAIPVKKESDKYYVFGAAREDLVTPNAERAIGVAANEIAFRVGTDTYSCTEYALTYKLADRIRDNSDDVMQLRRRGTQQILSQLMLAKERRLQALFQTTGGTVSSATISTKWDASSPDPEGDIHAAKSIVRRAIGREPNSILMSRPVADALVRYLKSSLTALNMQTQLTFVDLPDVLWGLKVYIGNGVYRTTNPGSSTVTVSDIWNDNVVVFYKEDSPSIDMMTFCGTFQARPFMTKSWREEKVNSEMMETSHIETEKLIAPVAGYILADALT